MTAEEYSAGATLLIDKAAGWTSFDVVNRLRNRLKKEKGLARIKVGHAGTLDPLATGLMILCTGRATKQLAGLMGHDKRYRATLLLGVTTPSGDHETEPDATYPTEHITAELLERTLQEQFVGTIMQAPPLHSAISVAGHRAYEYARGQRQGIEELPKRPVNIYSIDLVEYAAPTVTLDIHCGTGTYIRSLARDLGLALHSGAVLHQLRRTHIGHFDIDQAHDINQLTL